MKDYRHWIFVILALVAGGCSEQNSDQHVLQEKTDAMKKAEAAAEQLEQATADRLKQIRSISKTMKNFPTINWALQVTHDPDRTVLLPYQQYLDHVAANPEDEQLLTDMRVTIEEDSLISGFKYVAMDIDDDKCLYLLYKLRNRFLEICQIRGNFN